MSAWAPTGWLAGSSLALGTPILLGRARDAGHEVEGSDTESAHAEDDHSSNGHGVHRLSLVMRQPSRGHLTRLLGH